MDNEKRKHIERIREDFQASPRIKDSLNNSIRALAQDLYSKDTHFIFELIQNAEDNTYKELDPSLSFRLTRADPTGTVGADGALIIQNNEIGFADKNVDAICAVGETTKSKIQGYIGEKGIGFKSVFRVTTTPHIFSNGYPFCLPEHDEETGLGYIVPQWIEKLPEGIEPSGTIIVLPLDKPGFGYERIEEMLQDVEPATILFLSKLKEIRIQTDTGDALTITKDDSQAPLVRVLVEGERQGRSLSIVDTFSLYTRTFNRPDDVSHEKRIGIDDRNVSVAFPHNEDKESAGKIFAYLPVRSDTGLPFLINADFILTSSREDVQRNVPWNRWLMNCVANLVADALSSLNEKGLLTVALLEALASKMHKLAEDSLFYPIVKAVHNALMDNELLPADDGTFVSGRNAKLASAEGLRTLLRVERLGELLKTEMPPKWISGDITERAKHDLWKYVREVLQVEEVTPENFVRKIDGSFLANQSDDWMVSFYRFLSTQKALWHVPLRAKRFIRLQDGSQVTPFREDNSPNAYLTVGMETETTLPIIKAEISLNEEVHKFLKDFGIPELDIVAEVIENILPKYTTDPLSVPLDEHKRDLVKIERAYSTDSKEKEKQRLKGRLRATPFVLANNPLQKAEYRMPEQAYFMSDELKLYFAGNEDAWFASSIYDQPIVTILRGLGISESVRIRRKPRDSRGHITLADYYGVHARGLNGFDPDIDVDGLEYALAHPTKEKSGFIWNNIAAPNASCILGIVETSTRQSFEDSNKEKKGSEFGRLLIETDWLPGSDEEFHTPSKLNLDDLPELFNRDERLADLIGMKKDLVAKLAEEAGVLAEDIELLRRHPEEFQEWKAAIAAQSRKPAFPTRPSANPERREQRVAEQINEAPEKAYEQRNRSVRTTREFVDPAAWLKNQYTNEAGEMICQICEDEMPFKKRDGEHYFEAVEALSKDHFSKEHEAQFLALCPLCAAMYKEFVKHDEDAMNAFKNALLNSEELQVVVELGELKTCVRFVETHYQDLTTIIAKS